MRSSEAACRARWSRRPRANIGVCRSASVLPSISKTLSSAQSPILMIDSRGPSPPGLGPVSQDFGLEHILIKLIQPGGIVGDDGDVIETLEQHDAHPFPLTPADPWAYTQL